MLIKPIYKAPLKLAFYSMFILYVLGDLYVFSGPIYWHVEKRIKEIGLSESALQERRAVALVYGDVITRPQLDVRLREDLFLRGKSESDFTPKELRAQRVSVLNRMVDDSLLRLKTSANDMRRSVDTALVEQEWNSFCQKFLTEDARKEALEALGIDDRVMRLRLEAKIQQEMHIEAQITSVLEPTEPDLEMAYKVVMRYLGTQSPRQVRPAKHIFLAHGKKTPETVETQATEILKQLQSGANFENLAKQWSEDEATSSLGGDLGQVDNRRILPHALEKTLFTLPSQIPQCVTTPLGVHIFVLGEVEKLDFPDYPTIKPLLRENLILLRRQKAVDMLKKELKREANSFKRIRLFWENV